MSKAYANIKPSHWAYNIVRHPAGALLLHWIFQGSLYMDATERWFKISMDVLLTLVFMLLLMTLQVPGLIALIAAFLLAHTLNFLFNGQIWGVLKHFGFQNKGWEHTQSELDRLQRRITQQQSIAWAGVYDSLSRDGWSLTSDIDLRLVRKPGFANGVQACAFVLRERARAFITRFPLDVYVFDSNQRLASHKEQPTVLYDGK